MVVFAAHDKSVVLKKSTEDHDHNKTGEQILTDEVKFRIKQFMNENLEPGRIHNILRV